MANDMLSRLFVNFLFSFFIAYLLDSSSLRNQTETFSVMIALRNQCKEILKSQILCWQQSAVFYAIQSFAILPTNGMFLLK